MLFIIRYYNSPSVKCADLSLPKPIIDNRRDPRALLISTGVNQMLHMGTRQMARQTLVRQTGMAEYLTLSQKDR